MDSHKTACASLTQDKPATLMISLHHQAGGRSRAQILKSAYHSDRPSFVPTSPRGPEDAAHFIMETEITDSAYGLPYFQASLFATILEDAMMEVRILVECNSELSLSKAQVEMGNLLAKKYQVEQPAQTDELEKIDVRNLGCIEYKINKLDVDRKRIQKMFLDFYLSLSIPRTFEPLAIRVQEIVDKIKYYNFLIADEAKNRAIRRELCKQLRQRRNHIKTVFYDTDCIIENLKTEVEDAALNAEIRSRYVDNWQRARTEQNTQQIKDKEKTPSENIEVYKTKHDHEQRVHTEIELLVTIAINETLQKVESWMNKYDKDMEAMDISIQRMKTKHITQVEEREELERTIEKHADLMKQWVEFKDAREKARLYREKMHHAANVIQAWWRGILVRQQLGPFKPPKGKKGKKK